MAADPDTIAIEADRNRLAEVRAFVRRRMAGLGADDEATADVVQAVDELVCNVIDHGYRGAVGGIDVSITGSPAADGALIRIRDHAPAFDPTTVPTPDLDLPLDRRPLGGMGVHLARTLTDGMDHRILPAGGNELTLLKLLATPSQEAPMDITTDRPSPDTEVVVLTGELDASNFERVIDVARDARSAGVHHLVMDLSGLTYMGSSGLVALHSAALILRGEEPPSPEDGWDALHRLGHATEGEPDDAGLVLVGPTPAVDRVLERTGLKRLFAIHPDVPSALAAIGAG